MIGYQRTGPDQTGFGQRLGRNDDPRAELKASGHSVGLVFDGGAQFERRFADPDAVAECQTEPVEDRGIDRRAEIPAAPGEGGAEFCGGASSTEP